MNKTEQTFYDEQKALIDLALDILEKEMPRFKQDYGDLFYDKKVPPHISQPLNALKNKIAFKPIYKKITTELGISQRRAKKLVYDYGFSYVLKNLDKFKRLKQNNITKSVKQQIDMTEKQIAIEI